MRSTLTVDELTDIILLMLGPILLVTLVLVARRAAVSNWSFSLKGILMLITLLAISMGAIAALVR